ncbi:MAG: FAD-dependent oxidoreductase [Syntrophobacteraceae bacterium]
MNYKVYDFVIIGSGAGGSTLAKELSRRGKQVILIEQGKPAKKLGSFWKTIKYFEKTKIKTPLHSIEGVLVWSTIMAGGPTVVSCGNGARWAGRQWDELGISLEKEFEEAENEMSIRPIAEELFAEGSRRILQAARELSYRMEPMPKFINPEKCRKCGECVYGCRYGAKWTALTYLNEAKKHGAELVYGTKVHDVLIENQRAKGIRGIGPKGEITIQADKVILAAGGLGTPAILQRSGIKNAGSGLFLDLFVNTYGVTNGINQIGEPAMTLVDMEFHKEKGFILSPFVNHSRVIRFFELGFRSLGLDSRNLLGIMTKIADEPNGQVLPDGTISKRAGKKDIEKLREGSNISRQILYKAGVDSRSFLVTKVQGAHPGGTAAIGRVVDHHLQTHVDNLFVCDSSVLPTSPGMPPILTIVALAKRLAKSIA